MIPRVPDTWNEPLPEVQLDPNTIVFNLPAMIPTTELLWGTGGVPAPLDLHGDRAANAVPAVGGTLESVVNQAATIQPPPPPGARVVRHNNNRRRHVPWSHRGLRAAASSDSGRQVPVAVDALVPCKNNSITNKADGPGPGSFVPSYGTCSATYAAGSCSGVPDNSSYPVGSLTVSATTYGTERESRQLTVEMVSSQGFSGTFTTTKTGDDHDSASHSINERDAEDEKSKEIKGKSSQLSVKKNRAAAVHNQSERKRRDRINEKMKTLQRMVPNASKTDKASMLDEVIDYLKQMQAQVNFMTRMPSIMMQQFQLMSMMGMGMNMGMGMGITGAGAPMPPPNMAGNLLPQPYMNPFMPSTGWDGMVHGGDIPMQQAVPAIEAPPVPMNPFAMYMSSQQSEGPNNMEACARMTALYQQFQQNHGA